MKMSIRSLAKDEKGQALILALILLAVGGLILAPLLAYMRTGLTAGGVCEVKMDELYAADAGVEDAVLKIQNNVDEVQYLYCGSGNHSWSYPEPCDPPFEVNGKNVAVTITWVNNVTNGATYEIISRATTSNNSGTTIKSYIDAEFVVRNLLDNAITSQGNIDLGSNSIVNGNVQYGGSLTGGGTVSGIQIPEAYANWPSANNLSNYYLANVTGAPDPGSSIDIKDTKIIGRCYGHGDLTIDNSGDPATLTLQGTVYIDGNLAFNESGSHNYTINLNGQTIFATGKITFPSVGQGKTPHVSVTGSGCIIAIGYIDFWPSISGSSTDFVFVMSIGGYVDFKPSGNFYGSLAGDVKVDLQPKCTTTWTPWQGRGINFPIEDYSYQTGIVGTATIRTWEVSPL
jgi:hypothetical protein